MILKKNSVIFKLTLFVVVIVFFSVSLIGIVNLINTYNEAKNRILSENVQATRSMNLAFEDYASLNRKSLIAFSEKIGNNYFTLKNNETTLVEYMRLLAESLGFELAYIGFEDNGKNYQSDGQILDLSKGYDTKNRGWYKEVKATGKLIVSDPYKSVSTGNMGITYAAPIYADGKFIGVIGADFSIEKFSLDITKYAKQNSLYRSFILDKEGQIIFHKNKDLLLTKTDLSINIANAIKANPNLLGRNSISEDNLFYAKDDKGKAQVVTCIQTLNPKYMVCSITDESVTTNTINKVLFQQFIIAFIAIIIALILVRFVIARSLKPIEVITAGLNSFFD
ncbi:methyl-accepting chemotaxis protein, partial [Campylobacter lari]|nr:methyl-accepting chemotaxis protein [Campylobacter lari]